MPRQLRRQGGAAGLVDMGRIAAALLICLTLAACGPRYATTYNLVPPKDAQGRACTRGCEISRDSCTRNCRIEVESCQRHNYYGGGPYVGIGAGSHGMSSGVGAVFPFGPSWGTGQVCSVQSCTKDCQETFNICYAACGGQVTESRTCTANCPAAQTETGLIR